MTKRDIKERRGLTASANSLLAKAMLLVMLFLPDGMVRPTCGRLPLGFAASLVEEPTGRKNGAWA